MISFPEYLNIAHELNQIEKDEDIIMGKQINLLDFIPEPRSFFQILRVSSFLKNNWREAVIFEVTILFVNDIFILNEIPLPSDEITIAKLACKTKLNIYGGLDKLMTIICQRRDMQIKDYLISWSSTLYSITTPNWFP